MKVSIIGTGYVGLVTGACLADVGNHVLCLDVDPRKLREATGWSPMIPLDQTLLDILNHWRSQP